jgi:transposase
MGIGFIDTLPDDCPPYLLLDNVAFHKTRSVVECMSRRGLVPVFVPPYSPQFNPIEYVFSYIKRRLRRIVDASGALRDDHILSSCQNIPEFVLWNCFAHCLALCSDIHKAT